MLRVRVLRHVYSQADLATLEQVEKIAAQQFPLASTEEVKRITTRLQEPMNGTFLPILLVLEDFNGKVSAFVSALFYRPLKLAHLEFISTAPNRPGGGLGSLLYERLREECIEAGCKALLLECLADDADKRIDKTTQKENRQRLKFYEHYGARPLINTGYEVPSDPREATGAFLVFDALDSDYLLPKTAAHQYIRAFLTYKYPKECPPEKIDLLLETVNDNPLQMREPRYLIKPEKISEVASAHASIYAIVIADKHDIHHVRDRGYVEAPVRIPKIKEELQKTKLFKELSVEETPDRHITAVHSKAYVEYLKKICLSLPEKKSIYPAVFPVRNKARPPVDLAMQAGYYCIDTFTPLNRNAFLAARAAVNCVLTAANAVLDKYPMAYALVRPPGHHAEKSAFGGFCYFNSSSIAAHYMSQYGKVAVLDIDYHHGNGTQDIFYERDDVYTVSIHGDPKTNYPFFSGFRDEDGEGRGKGYNLNIPLADSISPEQYRKALAQALSAIKKFKPAFLIIALGLDTAKNDPTGTWTLAIEDFKKNGVMLGELALPTLIVQEGGYRTRTLGQNARAFFEGYFSAQQKIKKTEK